MSACCDHYGIVSDQYVMEFVLGQLVMIGIEFVLCQPVVIIMEVVSGQCVMEFVSGQCVLEFVLGQCVMEFVLGQPVMIVMEFVTG